MGEGSSWRKRTGDISAWAFTMRVDGIARKREGVGQETRARFWGHEGDGEGAGEEEIDAHTLGCQQAVRSSKGLWPQSWM